MNSRFTYEFNKNATFDDLLRNSFVLSISNVQCQFFYDNMSKLSLKNMPIRMQGLTKELLPGIKLCQLCGMSHCQMINLAKLLWLPYIIIFEDDSLFNNHNTIEELNDLIHHIPDGCSGVAFGRHCFDDSKTIQAIDNISIDENYFLSKRKPIWGSNAYLLFRDTYDMFLSKAQTWAIDRTFELLDNFLVTKENFFSQKRIDFTDTITGVSI